MKGQHSLLSYLLLSCFLCATPSFCQSVIITVVDGASRTSIESVEVFNEDYSTLSKTDQSGKVSLDTSSSKIFHFSIENYSLSTVHISQLKMKDWTLLLTPLSEEIKEIVITERASFKENDKFHQIQTVSAQDIRSTQSQTSADLLNHHGGVYVQKSQMGGGSPIIRGFEANRVLLVVDGVRMNNAIYRGGHLQNAITIDASILQDVKVLYGPNSLVYGSDAIGGVVAYTTRMPQFSTGEKVDFKINMASRYSSANSEKYGHVDINLGGQKWASLTSFSVSDYGDLRMGSNRDERFPSFGLRSEYVSTDDGIDEVKINPSPNIQVGTAYTQYDLLQKLKFKISDQSHLTTNFQLSTSSNVPRYDNLQENTNGQYRYAEWYYGPQTRLLASAQWRNYAPSKWYDQYNITAAYQRINEDRISRLFGSSDRVYMEEDVTVASLNGEFEKVLTSGWKVLYGFDTQWNDVGSSAYIENNVTGTVTQMSILTRYANDGNRLTTYGLFSEMDWTSEVHPLSIKAGVRLSGNNWAIKYRDVQGVDWPQSFIDGVHGNNEAFTWSLSGIYGNDNGFFARSMISSAFRAPNIDDLSKIRVNFNEITFPNPSLSPEKALSGEISLGHKSSGVNISTTAFFTALDDAIVRRPFTTPDGSATYDNLGEVLSVVGNQNAQQAHIYGFSINGEISITDNLSVTTSNSYTVGREIREGTDNLPFAHIPPFYGNTSIRYESDIADLQFVIRYNGAKDISEYGGSVDNPDLATPIGSLAWTTYNLYSTFSISDQIQASVALENIFDVHYRPFASGLSGAGRNFVVGVRYGI